MKKRLVSNRIAGMMTLLSVVSLMLAVVFKSSTVVFYGLTLVILVLALAVALKAQFQRDTQALVWIVPLGLAVMLLAGITMYLLVMTLNK